MTAEKAQAQNGGREGAAAAINWERLARSEVHPARIDILELLLVDGGRALSPNEMAYELHRPLPTVAYHVTELARTGTLIVAGKCKVRGTTEHFYCLDGVEDHELKSRPPFVRTDLAPAITRA